MSGPNNWFPMRNSCEQPTYHSRLTLWPRIDFRLVLRGCQHLVLQIHKYGHAYYHHYTNYKKELFKNKFNKEYMAPQVSSHLYILLTTRLRKLTKGILLFQLLMEYCCQHLRDGLLSVFFLRLIFWLHRGLINRECANTEKSPIYKICVHIST